MSLLSLEEGRARALSNFLKGLTAARITKYVGFADKGYGAFRRGRSAWRVWKKHTDLRICAVLALWLHGTLTTPRLGA